MKKKNFDTNPFGKGGEKPEVEYPVNYNLKVIFDTSEKQEVQQRNLELVLEDSQVNHEFVKSKHSSKGNYVSLTMNVTLESEEQMTRLYKRMKLLPGIRFAV